MKMSFIPKNVFVLFYTSPKNMSFLENNYKGHLIFTKRHRFCNKICPLYQFLEKTTERRALMIF